jgi:glycosyltransferase involved in cell wall biosynthesis
LKVLVVPASYKVGLEGSDPEVSYQLLRGLATEHGFQITALTHKLTTPDLAKAVTVTELGLGLGGSIAEQLLYQVRLYQRSRGILIREKFDIIHHMAPFLLESGFNPLMIIGKRSEKFVVGPVAFNTPLEKALVPDTMTRWGSRMDNSDLYLTPLESTMELALSKFVGYLGAFRRVLSQRTLERANAIIAINRFSFEAISRHTDKRKIHLIPLGVDTSEFKHKPPSNCFRIVSSGPLQKRRGIDYLIKAVSIVSQEYPQVELYITGDGPHRTLLQSLVGRLGLDGNVRFLGYLPRGDLIRVLESSRLYCHPSIHETFGISILEAMSIGRPVVAADSVGPREIVVDKHTGFLVSPKSPESLAAAILRIFEDYSLALQMGQNARIICEKLYDWRVISKSYAELYSGLSP